MAMTSPNDVVIPALSLIIAIKLIFYPPSEKEGLRLTRRAQLGLATLAGLVCLGTAMKTLFL